MDCSPTFESLKLSRQILADIRQAGFAAPTPIQAQAIPPALTGSDVIGCAQTGTGKTAAFVIPIIQRLAGEAGLRALVLAPTRELALQTQECFDALGGASRIRSIALIGGEAMGPQLEALRRRPDVVVATPGRLLDHLDRRSLSFGSIRTLVLDEADRMLDMGFAPQIERILKHVPLDRQTLCFSATMPPAMERLVRGHLVRPVRVQIGLPARPVGKVSQVVYPLSRDEKTPLLLSLLRGERGKVLVFTRTKHRADRVARVVGAAGHRVARLHADRSQSQRRQALDGFRAGRYQVLVATDVAARGIDVANISHVINYDLPGTPEDYIHRIGRTARAEASGLASSFAAPEERDQLRAIERHLGQPLRREGGRARSNHA
ncbi:MAG: DEAD/DEAH box helicase [Candidatus Rokubacteria bacterium]|nr:DEAD/DEAH box helicase [Candidatus Rokubacteria bacterium]